MSLVVKVAQIGREVKSYAVEAGTTVEQIIRTAGINGRPELSINGVRVNRTAPVYAECTIVASKMIKGNNDMEVAIAVLGSSIPVKTYYVSSGISVRSVLELAAQDGENFYSGGQLGYEVRVDASSVAVADTTVLNKKFDGTPTRLFLSKMIKGNNTLVNPMEVAVAVLGSSTPVKTYYVESGSTVKDVLSIAAQDGENFYSGGQLGYEVRVDASSVAVSDTTSLTKKFDGAPTRLFLSKMIKGNETAMFDVDAAIASK